MKLSMTIAFIGLAFALEAHAQVSLEQNLRREGHYHTNKSINIDLITGEDTVGFHFFISESESSYERIGRARDDGTLPIEVVLDSRTSRMRAPVPGLADEKGLEIIADSEGKNVKISDKAYDYVQEAYAALRGWKYTLVIGPNSELRRVENLGSCVVRAEARKASPEAIAMLRRNFGMKRIKQEFLNTSAWLPGKPVRIGDSWERSVPINPVISNLPINLSNRYEYKGTKIFNSRIVDVIEFRATQALADRDSPFGESKVIRNSLKIGSSSGEILFDRKLGRLVVQREKTDITGIVAIVRDNHEHRVFLDAKFDSTWASNPVDDTKHNK